MDNTKQLNKAIEYAQRASELNMAAQKDDQDHGPGSGRWDNVIVEYMRAIEHFTFCIKYENNPELKKRQALECIGYENNNSELKKRLIAKREAIITQAENIKDAIRTRDAAMAGGAGPGNTNNNSGGNNNGNSSDTATLGPKSSQSSGGSDGGGGKNGDKNDKEDDKLKNACEELILAEKPNVKWDDIAGLKETKDTLKETVIMPQKFPQLFTGKRKPWKGILLYGPPGTGKSQIARCVATECDSTFMSVDASNLMSKWQGESERTVRSLFELAREKKPCVVFIDEIDSLCSARGEGDSESAKRVKTTFLTQLDGVGNDMKGILMLSATNCPWDIDSAMRRRFEKRLLIPLPDIEGRRAMVNIGIGDTPCQLSEEERMLIAERTEGYSGADINILCREALMIPIAKCRRAERFKRVIDVNDGNKEKWTPCSPHDPQGVKMSLFDINGDNDLLPPISNVEDFMEALGKTRPSVGTEELEKYWEWTKQYGQDGNGA